MNSRELREMFIFNMMQRMHQHVTMEEVDESVDTSHTLPYQIANVPFNIDTIYSSGDIDTIDLPLRMFIRTCVQRNDLASLYEKYINIFPTGNLVELFLIEAGIANITLRQQNEFTCVLYSATVYNPTYGNTVESLTEFLSNVKYSYGD